MNASKLRRGSGKVATRRTGPNDANCVVWAISTCFLFLIGFFFYSFIYTGTMGATELRRDALESTKRKTGPNDAIRVVWAIW